MSEDPPQHHQNPENTQDGHDPILGTSVYTSEIDPELQEIAKKRMWEALKGNGVKVEDIELTKFEGETLEFLGITELVMDNKLAITTRAGKLTTGVLVPNRNAFQEIVNKEIYKIAHSIDVIERMKDAIMERDDKGLALENVLIKLPFLHKTFIAHEQCNTCHAQGKINCPRCQGKGTEPCPRCHATGYETCPACGGRQYIAGPNGQNQHCQRCNGTGKTGCTQCHESRTVQCSSCKGTRTIHCQQCNGHAWNSVICLAEINPVATYTYDEANVPEKAKEKIDELGSDIQHHANIQVIQRTKEMEKERDDIAIPYHIKVPIADVEFKIRNMDVPGFLFGTQGMLHDMPPFLEKVAGKGIKALKAAAMGQGDIAKHLQTAGRYKTLRHLILDVSKFPPKKALAATMKRNPIGLSEDNAKKLIVMAGKSLGLVNKKPAQIGWAIGLMLAGALGAFYYLAGREALAPQLPSQQALLGLDALTALIALGIGYVCAKLYTKQALKNTLEKLFGALGKEGP